MIEQPELFGLSEVAEMFGVSKQVIGNWRLRYHNFPKPLAELKSGPVWKREDIVIWAKENNIPVSQQGLTEDVNKTRERSTKMAITVALVNMKGGVGKSTLTTNLGWYCAHRKNKRVLLVDLDPQFNLSQYALGPSKYEQHITDGKQTILDIFEQFTPSAVSGAPKGKIAPSNVIVNITKPYSGGVLDLIPSRLELAWTLKNPHAKEHLLSDLLDEIRDEYELILIDCPPTESMLTIAAYLASDSVLVPVRPEFLSTIGLPLLIRSLEEFRGLYKNKTIDLVGIVFNASRETSEYNRSRAFVAKVAKDKGWYIFQHEVTFSDSYPAGSRAGRPIFLTDYARSWKIADFSAVAEEFIGRIGL
jgi:chromosome partitioning protein